MNVLFLSRLKIRTKGREGEISMDLVTYCYLLLFLRGQLNLAGFLLLLGGSNSLAQGCAWLMPAVHLWHPVCVPPPIFFLATSPSAFCIS